MKEREGQIRRFSFGGWMPPCAHSCRVCVGKIETPDVAEINEIKAGEYPITRHRAAPAEIPRRVRRCVAPLPERTPWYWRRSRCNWESWNAAHTHTQTTARVCVLPWFQKRAPPWVVATGLVVRYPNGSCRSSASNPHQNQDTHTPITAARTSCDCEERRTTCDALDR